MLMENAFPGWVTAFQRLSESQINLITRKLFKKKEKKTEEKPPIHCINCKNVITSTESAIPVGGQHRHFFKNPVGVDYEIGCFSSAEGCINVGHPTTEFTWFSGYSWSYALCSRCMIHLGWFYQSTDNHFYGLILNRLTVEN
ncbi:MAG: cereblon family protein [Candidatus Omnitrophota bacterium]